MKISPCCSAPVQIMGEAADLATHFYVCTACWLPCEPVPPREDVDE